MALTDEAQVHHHPQDGSTVLPILKSRMPNPIALYRRIQLPHRSSSSYILATFKPKTPDEDLPRCFAIVFTDRGRRPDAEVWLFLSGQAENTKRCPASSKTHCPACTAALLAIFAEIGRLPVPRSIHLDEETTGAHPTMEGKPLNEYARHILDPTIVLVGSLAQLPFDILLAHGLIRTELPHAPYQKFITPTASLSSTDTTLPDGLMWGEVRQQDYELVKSRTEIPRKDKTLALCPSIAIFPSATGSEQASPIAWGFIGMDGALATLHTEPQYRGRGLAKKLTTKLFTEKLRLLDPSEGDQEGGWWAHSDVGMNNLSSQAVAKGLGGAVGWVNYWVRVDMAKVQELAGA